MTKNAHKRRIATALAVLAIGLTNTCWVQTVGAETLQRIPASKGFEPQWMPFTHISPVANYEAMGTAPWVTLKTAGAPKERYLDVATLRLTATRPAEPANALPPPAAPPSNRVVPYTAQDVREAWLNRSVALAWLDFEGGNRSLIERLQAKGALPSNARVQTLTSETYAEISTAPATLGQVVLKTHTSKTITPQEPTPTSVKHLFHQVFVACVDAEHAVKPALAAKVFGTRYERDKLCGFMGDGGKWLAQPEFSFMEDVDGWGQLLGRGPLVLMLRKDEPCITPMHLPIQVTCLGQPLSALYSSTGLLLFSKPGATNAPHADEALGYVGRNGEWVIEPRFNAARGFSGKVASVQIGDIPALIDNAGQWITPAVPSDPVAARWLEMRVRGHESGAGQINRAGQMVVPFVDAERLDTSRYRVCHRRNCKTATLPAVTTPQVAPITAAVNQQTLRSAAAWVASGENGKWGYQDSDGRWTLRPQFEDAEPFENGVARVKAKGQWGMILPSGKWLHPAEFDSIGDMVNGIAMAVSSGQSRNHLLHANGKRVELSDGYPTTHFGSDGLAVAESNRMFGYIDRDGQWVIAPKFDQAKPFQGGYAEVKGKLEPTWRPPGLTEPPYILRSVHWLSPNVMALRALVNGNEQYGLMDNMGNWLVLAP